MLSSLLCAILHPFLHAGGLQQDTVRLLSEVTVKAYAYDRKAVDVPGSVAVITPDQLLRFNSTSLLPAVNMIPAVRMEERSPGSYRFSIRGSTLRSPFGVRNVKFYWNGLPLTDGGGNTYLNLVDLNALGNIEIVKGPGSSLYGAGTGGVVLLRSSTERKGTQLSIQGGSYGMFRSSAGGSLVHNKKLDASYRLAYQQADGYRAQTKMNRGTANFDLNYSVSRKSTMSMTLLLSKLYYQTPGGLTLAEYQQDPAQARPGTPGAVQQQASVTNNTGYAGIQFEHEYNSKWSTRAGIYGSLTDFVNPSIRNYEVRSEQNAGARTDTQFHFDRRSIKGKITFGGEYQHFYSPVTDYDNNNGVSGNVQTADVLRSFLLMGFAQLDLDLPHGILVSAGGSVNAIRYNFTRTSVNPEVSQERTFDPVVSPRLSVLKKLSDRASVYASISDGFSPPSLAEVRPSTATFNNTLNAERGVSYEIGFKGKLNSHLDALLTGYDFRMRDAIVIQRDPTGADYFVNAGSTLQQGIEAKAGWTQNQSSKQLSWKAWVSYSYNHYFFHDYVTAGKDYSGNALTGVSPTFLALGADLTTPAGWYANLTAQFSDKLPLNDANTEYADSYFLLGLRAGYMLNAKIPIEFFAGVDNALDQRYTLGADLNAAGGRYYNAAPRRNFYFGASLKIPSSAH